MQLSSLASSALELQLLPLVLHNLITTTPNSAYMYIHLLNPTMISYFQIFAMCTLFSLVPSTLSEKGPDGSRALMNDLDRKAQTEKKNYWIHPRTRIKVLKYLRHNILFFWKIVNLLLTTS